MKKQIYILSAAALISSAQAVTINVGTEGFSGNTNNWPGGEAPSFAIDGVEQKYLNFGVVNTGIVVTPAGGAAVASSLTLWAANDAVERDPTSYQVFGTNSEFSGTTFTSSIFTLVSEGALSLPTLRSMGGAMALNPATATTVNFANTESYTSYLILFPTVQNSSLANSLQIAEVQLFDGANGIFAPGDTILGVQSVSTIPEPSTGLLSLLAATVLLGRRRR